MVGLRYIFALMAALALTVGARGGEAGTPPDADPPKIGSTPETTRAAAPSEKSNRNKYVRPADSLLDLTPSDLGLKPASAKDGAGEVLVYDVRVNGIPAGKTRMEVSREQPPDGPEVWVAKMTSHSNRAISMLPPFYKVKTEARSRIDVKGGFSRYYTMDMNEGDLKAQEQILFKYDIGAMDATYRRPRADGTWREYKLPLTGKTLDPLAAVYYFRSKGMDLANVVPNRQKPFVVLPICADRRVWNTAFFAVDRRIEDVGALKNRNCLIVEPEAEFKGLFERKGKLRVWLDIETGMVLKMTAEIPIGSAEAVLSEFKNAPIQE